MTQLRFGALPHHPVPIIVQILMAGEPDYVRKVIDSGPDDIVQLPLAPPHLISRLHVLADKRKTFIVTSDYIGPDRRQGNRPGTPVIPLIDVPNPLAAKMKKQSDESLTQEIEQTSRRLREMRLARHLFELQWLLRAIRLLFEQGPPDDSKLLSFCERIKIILAGLPKLMPDGLPSAALPMRERLEMGANIVVKNGFAMDIAVLRGLAAVATNLVHTLRDTLPPDLAETIGGGSSAAPAPAG